MPEDEAPQLAMQEAQASLEDTLYDDDDQASVFSCRRRLRKKTKVN
jgi:hypothetical protein